MLHSPLPPPRRPPHQRGRLGGRRANPRALRRTLAGSWRGRLIGALAIFSCLVGAALGAGAGFVAGLPSVADAEQRVHQILRAHGGTDSRLPLPPKLAAAIVAVEDEHFYSNFVTDILDGMGRAALAALQTASDPGGSTIVQQLAKQLYVPSGSLPRTLEEIGLGVKLSLTYPKRQILEMYLSVVYYGNGYWGDVAAARGYFDTTPARLDWAQAAMLAGLPQAPSAYDPVGHLALAKQRQEHVLDRLVATHWLTAAQAQAVAREPLPIR